LRTYSHLATRGQVPSEYEIVSSRLLYHPQRGFEIDVPVGPWYARYGQGGRLRGSGWEAFVDPRETTYASYTRLQAGNEQHLDAVARSFEQSGHAARLPEAWRTTVSALVPPLRFAWHGLQMMAAYLGQMAPAGRLTLVSLFLAADQLRRIHRVAMFMAPLQAADAQLAQLARTDWQEGPAWQPLRRAVEEGLVAYDWGESFAALCLGLLPALDDLLLHEGGALARQAGDFYLGEVLASFAEDARWHRAVAAALVAHAVREDAGNESTLAAWVARWAQAGRAAAAGLAPLLVDANETAPLLARAEARTRAFLDSLGLPPPQEGPAR
jgi:toluene monooxygenase system protein E